MHKIVYQAPSVSFSSARPKSDSAFLAETFAK
jgi:hypothetical protein